MKYLLYASLASLALASPNRGHKGPKPKAVDPVGSPSPVSKKRQDKNILLIQ